MTILDSVAHPTSQTHPFVVYFPRPKKPDKALQPSPTAKPHRADDDAQSPPATTSRPGGPPQDLLEGVERRAILDTARPSPTLDHLYHPAHFTPNDRQREVVTHTTGPLYTTTVSGSGKTCIQATIDQFAQAVDDIKERRFAPPPVTVLNQTLPPTRTKFGTRICRYCDARFSCPSYRAYALQGRRTEHDIQHYFADPSPDIDQDTWRTANVTTARNTKDLERDFLD